MRRTAKDMMKGDDQAQAELASIITDAKSASEKHTALDCEIQASISALRQRAGASLSQVPWAETALTASKPQA